MARRSKGLKSKGRGKFMKRPRERGQTSVIRAIQELPLGARVAVIIEPSVTKGQPHHRYHGRIGVIEAKVGRGYVVGVSDGGKTKKVISGPEHLKRVR
ncbi:MAG: 50S ribosomal protein L21e [Candidatus Hadarchaeota archaeon]